MSRKRIRGKPKFKRKELKLEELKGIVERVKSMLNEEEQEVLNAAVETLAFLTQEIEAKGASIRRLRHLIFGSKTEKTSQVFKESPAASGDDSPKEETAKTAGDDTEAPKADDGKNKPKKKRTGHGRRGAKEYTGAKRVKVPHASLKPGDPCPACDKGKVYEMKAPAVIIRVKGMAPIDATVYELMRLRCNLCGEVFKADAPLGIGKEKYDETAAGMIALLKYGCGMPLNRLERLEAGLGIPLPSGTQWDLVAEAAAKSQPAYEELVRQGAQGKVLHNDDTTAKILELIGQSQKEAMEEVDSKKDEDKDEDKDKNKNEKERTGVFTTGIISVHEDHKIALFFTGKKHAGENLQDVLAKRAEALGPPIQMCDMLSRNTKGDFETILAGCLVHSRRKYVEVAKSFPEEVRHVLEELKEVYQFDDITKKQNMTDEERLAFHQENSGPVMERLKEWLDDQKKQKKVEPNSGLGQAIGFMQKHWKKLTLFLRVAGAPLDNNIVERGLKKAILHRKNALFFKTENGAHVGDMFMSFIHTAELNGIDPFDYLVTLQRHADEVEKNPADWMPWNYKEILSRLDPDPNTSH